MSFKSGNQSQQNHDNLCNLMHTIKHSFESNNEHRFLYACEMLNLQLEKTLDKPFLNKVKFKES